MSERPLTGVRVLLVDDDPIILETFALLVERAGAEVTAVTSALAAVALVERAVFDVVVTDLLMPELDGAALLRRVQHARADADRDGGIPVIAISGTAAVDAEAAGGFFAYLTKPVTMETLIPTIAAAARA